jgi:hypothetical protein
LRTYGHYTPAFLITCYNLHIGAIGGEEWGLERLGSLKNIQSTPKNYAELYIILLINKKKKYVITTEKMKFIFIFKFYLISTFFIEGEGWKKISERQ